MKHDQYQHIDELAKKFESSLECLVGTRHIAVLADFPNHPNVGDSAIYLGELAALNNILLPTSELDVPDSNDLSIGAYKKPKPGEVILIHGGGNFGDLWLHHHEARLRLIAEFTSCRIIQLPQSIYFGTEEWLLRTKSVIANHPDFHLMVRDSISEQTAKAHFQCPIYVVPDAALSLRKLLRIGAPKINILGLLRSDKEQLIGKSFQSSDPMVIEDWLEEPLTLLHRLDILLKWYSARYPGSYNYSPFRLIRRSLYKRLAYARLIRGVKQLSKAENVVTDRLHAFIMCTLLGIKCEVSDNIYGKIGNIRKTWGI